jgi:hypothetical protein
VRNLLLIPTSLVLLTAVGSPLYSINTQAAILSATTKAKKPSIKSLSEADSIRMKVLQALHVAQAPLHSKQDKANQAEIDAYTAAVKQVDEFKRWLVGKNGCAVSLRGEAATSSNSISFSKAVWSIHDTELKLEPPYTRNDIGKAVKVMNDAREILKLPVSFSSSGLPDRVR